MFATIFPFLPTPNHFKLYNMSDQFNQVRIKRIYQMLFEMAIGNRTFRIQDNSNDELKNMATSLNKIAEELQKINLETGYFTAYYRYQNLIQLIFVLDNNFVLLSFNMRLLWSNSRRFYQSSG